MGKEQNYESHSFSVELASKIGLEETLILGHFYHWCVGNSDNEDMFKDGHIWLYITRKRINEKYPYITENKIKGAINKLYEKGLIKISNYNKLKIDKTNWYALTSDAYALFGTSLVKITDRWLNSPSNGENNQAIQSIKQNYIDKSIKEDTNVSKKKFNFKEALIDIGVSENVASDWLIVRKEKKGSNTQTAFNAIAKEINSSKSDADICIRIAVERSWCGFKADWIENILSKDDKIQGRISELQRLIDGQKNEKGEVWSTQLKKWLK